MSHTTSALSPLDPQQRYTIVEAAGYLRISRAYLFRLLGRGELRSITDGSRRYIPGSELIRRSTLPAPVAALRTTPAA